MSIPVPTIIKLGLKPEHKIKIINQTMKRSKIRSISDRHNLLRFVLPSLHSLERTQRNIYEILQLF